MGCEYIFFDESLRDRFIVFVSELGVPSQFRPDTIAGFVVELTADVSDVTEEALEREYETLMDLQRDLLDANEGEDSQDVMGVNVTLPGGEDCLVRLPAAYGRRLVQHFTFEEIHELVSLIARQGAEPASGPLCRKV